MTLDLSIACGDRDLHRPLLDGEVEIDGIEATTTAVFPSNRHRRFFRTGEFDVSEISLATYLAAQTSPEEYPYTAIPVFPEKKFRHSFLYKRTDADIETPADLAGRNVGISSWQTTANVWMRGIAGEHYGLDLEAVSWHFRKRDDVARDPPDRFDVTMIPRREGTSVGDRANLEAAFLNGDVDAVMDPSSAMFDTVVESDRLEFLFDDPLETEKAYFRQTGIHPPMHAVAIKNEILQEDPWVADRLFEAFRESKDRCLETNVTRTKTSLTWAHLHKLHQEELLGDTWEYGLTDRNRRSLEKLIEYASNQGVIPTEYDPEDLFLDVERSGE